MRSMRCRSALALLLLASGCFVSGSDCVQQGVTVTPCTIQLRPGQTAVLEARIPGAPAEPVSWFVPEAAGILEASANGNRLVLISISNVSASIPVQATSDTDSSLYGGSVIGVSAATFGGLPPPLFVFGGGFPVGTKAGATAVGGNLYFVAYADSLASAQATSSFQPGESTNRFLKRYTLAGNQLSVDVPDQFLFFTGPDAPIVPNVVADCAGNAYWIDLATLPNGYVLRRLAAGSNTVEERPFLVNQTPRFQSMSPRTLAVSCQGEIFFIAEELSFVSLWRLASFFAPPEPVSVPELDDFAFVYESLAVDEAGRLLAATRFPDGAGGFPALVRLIVRAVPGKSGEPTDLILVGEPDPVFVADDGLGGVSTFALDRHGAVYAARVALTPLGDPLAGVLSVHNTRGDLVYLLDRYPLQCPPACSDPACGTDVPFTDIQWLGVATDGRLRIVDALRDPDPLPGCDESVRLVLLEPQ